MKKEYIIPQMQVEAIEMEAMLVVVGSENIQQSYGESGDVADARHRMSTEDMEDIEELNVTEPTYGLW